MPDHPLYAQVVTRIRKDLRESHRTGVRPLLDVSEWSDAYVDIHEYSHWMSISPHHGSRIDLIAWSDELLEPDQQYSNDEDGSFAWVAMNSDALYKQYPDRWILVDNARVVSSASEPEELLRLARTLGIEEPFITITTPPETPGKAVYGTKVV